jgi:spoIIIJ-associated protein
VSERKYTLTEFGPKVEEFLDTILDAADWDLEYELLEGNDPHPEIENPDIVVKFYGDDLELLQANKGEALLALEHLTMEALRMPHEDHNLLRFDVNDMRLMRIEELRANALVAAEQVKATHRPFRFNTMSSRERRIIHLTLNDDKEIRSESEGMAPHRNVVIYPADMPSQPRAFVPPPPRRPSGDRDRGGDRRGPGGDRGRRGPGGERRGGGGRDRGRGPRGPR